MIEIKSYSEDMAIEIADLFHAAVHNIDSSIYTKEQQEAWAPTPPDYDHWSVRLKNKKPFIAVIDGHVAGFIELDEDGHIDCAYTHPDFQRKGVATTLYNYLLIAARRRKIDRLYVDASHMAKPFFEQLGFTTIKMNEILLRGVVLANFTMQKYLNEIKS
ncbi:GNAT family N-acetyltransferase [Leeia oryzae]|uniref:GNAT family N-acetyltransferase n=1 Tax=Leeia oryzae TaxID=356662 RepID=UPI00037344D5|nr:GNAT family N-acetyltransferase [Leeia oryzae]